MHYWTLEAIGYNLAGKRNCHVRVTLTKVHETIRPSEETEKKFKLLSMSSFCHLTLKQEDSPSQHRALSTSRTEYHTFSRVFWSPSRRAAGFQPRGLPVHSMHEHPYLHRQFQKCPQHSHHSLSCRDAQGCGQSPTPGDAPTYSHLPQQQQEHCHQG